MPKVLLTQEQRMTERYRRLRVCIGDRVASAKRREDLTLMDLANGLSMGHTTVAKLMDGADVSLSTTKFLQVLDLAGLMLVDRRQDEIHANRSEQ